MKVILRDYQARAIENLRLEFCRGHKKTILVAPCGAGKTTIAAEMIKSAVSRGSSVLFLAHRKELIEQASARLDTYDIDHGIIKAGTLRAKPRAVVQVASVQTLVNRRLPPASLVVVDECHRAVAKTYKDILCNYPEAAIIGLTATPCRTDGKGLADLFDSLIEAVTTEDLIASGVLVAPKVFAPQTPDLAGVKTTAGDYNQGQVADVMDKPRLVGNIVEHWFKYASGRQTVVFAASVEHSIHLRDAFRDAGVRAEHISGTSHQEERGQILRDLASGKIQVVTNCAVLTEGWDFPGCSCGILARPTKSEGLFLQMVGRIMRSAQGKTDTILLDHAGASFEHGLASVNREWSLTQTKKEKEAAPSIKNCPHCYAIVTSATTICPECGYAWNMVKAEGRAEIEHVDGELVEFTPDMAKAQRWTSPTRESANELWHGLGEYLPADPDKPTREEKECCINWLEEEQQKMGFKPGWVAWKYKEVFGVWPRGLKKTREVII